MRVLMVTGAYYPEISASAVQCREVARQLAGRADVHVLTTAVGKALPREECVEGVGVSRVHVDVDSRVSTGLASARMLCVLRRWLPWCDVVHLHGVSSKNVLVTAGAKSFRRPVVLSLHTAGFDEPAAVAKHGRPAMWAFARADRYLGVSRSLVDAYLSAGLDPERIDLVPNGMDVDRFSPASADERRSLCQQLDLPAGRPVVLFVGFFSLDKQPSVLLDAWLRARSLTKSDPTLLFVGATRSAYFEVDDGLEATMRGAISAQGLEDRVFFAGPRHDVHNYFRAADVYVLPSRREGLPVALLEAMSCGLPCVASRLPGSTDTIIDSGVNGLLVEPGDTEGFARAIVGVIDDGVWASSLGRAARETAVARFSDVSTAERWLDAYHSVMSAGRA